MRALLLLLGSLLTCALLQAQQPITFQYIYDDLNQLSKVIDSTGVVLTYVYDPVGNILQVSRSTVSAGGLTIFNVTPTNVVTGGHPHDPGQGFSVPPSANVVTLNVSALTVVSATTTTVMVAIPVNATSGTISITAGGVNVSSTSPVTVLPVPTILSLSPKAALAGSPLR